MTVYRTRKSGGRQYGYFRCKNKECSREKHDVRDKVILGALEGALALVVSTLSEGAYDEYLEEMGSVSSATRKRLRSDNTGLKSRINALRRRNDALQAQLPLLRDPRAIDNTNQTIIENLNEIDKIQSQINKNRQKLDRADVKVRKYSKEEFDQMVQNLDAYFKKANIFQKERILREIFLNFSYGDKKVTSFSLKAPFDALCKDKLAAKFAFGGG